MVSEVGGLGDRPSTEMRPEEKHLHYLKRPVYNT